MTTIGYLDLADGTNADFDRARRKAFLSRILARFHGVGRIDAKVTEYRNPGEEIPCR